MYLKLYNGRNLLSVPFNSNNINSFGTKLADILFSKRELYQGMFEPGRGFDMRRVPLDQSRVNLIKICYLHRARSLETFLEWWPTVLASLRQKCRDTRDPSVPKASPAEARAPLAPQDESDSTDSADD